MSPSFKIYFSYYSWHKNSENISNQNDGLVGLTFIKNKTIKGYLNNE